MTQTQTTKRVSPRKPAPVKAEAETKAPRRAVSAIKKTAEKTAPKSVIAHVAGAAVKFFVFIEGARPVSGTRLSAHTDAALRFLGLLDSGAARKAAAIAVMGNRAVKYHIERGNFVEEADKIKLTKQGLSLFADRATSGKVDAGMSKAFLAAIQKGKVNTDAGIKDSHLIPVGMVVR